MRLSDLRIFGFIFALILVGEIALEARAVSRGFEALLFSRLVPARASAPLAGQAARVGPTPDFPFRSPLPEPTEGISAVGIWWSSSSYAADARHSITRQFPNETIQRLRRELAIPFVALNRSSPGLTIRDNVADLKREGAQWLPSVAVLYQMTNDISEIAGWSSGRDSAAQAHDSEGRTTVTFDRWSARPRRLWEQTTLYAQLSANLTPRVAQHRLLADTLPAWAEREFRLRVTRWIEVVRSIGGIPVLATMATQLAPGVAPDDATRLWILRWSPHLTPRGYLATLRRWNQSLREVAQRENVPLVDVDGMLSGQPGLFVDLVHFSLDGHNAMAEIFTQELAGLVEVAQ